MNNVSSNEVFMPMINEYQHLLSKNEIIHKIQ
jgi:hypothetical protein